MHYIVEGKGKGRMKQAIFEQAEHDKLILLRRWAKKKQHDHQKNELEQKLEDFNRDSFGTFLDEEVRKDILDEIMEELMLNSEVMKQTLKDKGVHTPAIFVEKSKYFYMHEMKLSGEDIHKIEMFKQWYKYQLDTYLPSDWVVLFRKEANQVTDLE